VKSDKSALLLRNTSGITNTLQFYLDCFKALYSRKAFVRIYTGDGMDMSELTEAQSCLEDLIKEY
jgi:tubulin beta